jgi:hypothetical protein
MKENLIGNLKAIPTGELVQKKLDNELYLINYSWVIKNEILPVDLFSYLLSKFGQPNGTSNLVKMNDSDNLFHWEWVLVSEESYVLFLGMNYRTEVRFKSNTLNIDRESFLKLFKKDIEKNRKKVEALKKRYECWGQYINPYFRTKLTIEKNIEKFSNLSSDLESDRLSLVEKIGMPFNREKTNEIISKHNEMIGLSFGLRAMLPILIESFINILLNLLLKDHIKSNKRLMENALRQDIDLRASNLYNFCDHFIKSVDFSSIHYLFNDRNDFFHGNILAKQLFIDDCFFIRNTPIFKSYSDYWEDLVGFDLKSLKFEEILTDYKAAKDFIAYVKTCIDANILGDLERFLESKTLGYNKKTLKFGVLFSNEIKDIFPIC